MKRFCWNCLWYAAILILAAGSVSAIILQINGREYDPIKTIEFLTDAHRRDDALDLVKFFGANHPDQSDQLAGLEQSLQYTTGEKLKSLIWNGAIHGEVYDTYSGIGAISADLCVRGDIRDLVRESWKWLRNKRDFDSLVLLLSGIGVGLSAAPCLDGVDALAKASVKYLKRIPVDLDRGMLKMLLSGKLSRRLCRPIWTLFEKTDGRFQEPYPA